MIRGALMQDRLVDDGRVDGANSWSQVSGDIATGLETPMCAR